MIYTQEVSESSYGIFNYLPKHTQNLILANGCTKCRQWIRDNDTYFIDYWVADMQNPDNNKKIVWWHYECPVKIRRKAAKLGLA